MGNWQEKCTYTRHGWVCVVGGNCDHLDQNKNMDGLNQDDNIGGRWKESDSEPEGQLKIQS